MDLFDDFEFKPLTEGLGFHKKNNSKNSQSQSSELPPLEPREKLSASIDKLGFNSKTLNFDTPSFEDKSAVAPTELPSLSPDISIFSQTLPRTESDVPKKVTIEPSISIPKFNPKLGRPLSNIRSDTKVQNEAITENPLLSVLEGKADIKANKVEITEEIKYVETAPSFLSLFLDLTVISGLSILFTLGLVAATRLNIVPILNNIMSDAGTQVGVALLIYSVSQLYLILSRAFLGQTLGEWSMDIELGSQKEQETVSYIFKLIARTLMITVTGFVILPILSIIFNKDIAGRTTGLKLYRR